MANQTIFSMGADSLWHRTHVRFGASTIKSFNDPYEEQVRLCLNDLVVIDIGPVWNKIEGDAGKSFVFGEDADKSRIVESCEHVFFEVKTHWERTKATGQQLLEFARQVAQKEGYVLAPAYVKGHRLAEFPHHIYSKSGLFDLDFAPAKNRWVLEIHICHPEMTFGAFYEDIM